MIRLSPYRFYRNRGALFFAMILALFALPAHTQAPSFDLHSIEVPDATGYAGWDNSLLLDDNGYPVVAYTFKDTITSYPTSLKILRCGDANCAGPNSIRALDEGQVVSGVSLQLDENGFPVISYLLMQTGGVVLELKLLRCNDINCDGNDESIVTIGVAELFETSLALDSDGVPIISYTSENGLILLHCDDPSCAPDGSGNPETGEIIDFGSLATMQLDADDNPVILYNTGSGNTMIVHCNDAGCAGGDESILLFEGRYSSTYPKALSMVLDEAGNPAVLYQKGSNLYMRRCNDANCAGNDETTFQVHNDNASSAQLQLGSDGIPVYSTHGWYAKSGLLVTRCDTPNCDVYLDTTRWVPDTYGSISGTTSMVLDANDFPVISYISQFSPRGELRILRCGDKPCTAYWRTLGVDFQPDDSNNVVNTDGPDGFYDPDYQVEFAVLGESDLDVAQIDPAVLVVYRGGYSQRARPVDPDGVIDDVNDDGFPDRTFTFNYSDIPLPTCQFSYGSRRMDIRGNLYSGEQIWGWDDLKQNQAPCKIGFEVNPYLYGTVHPHHDGLCSLPGQCDNQNDDIRVQFWETQNVDLATIRLGPGSAALQPGSPYTVPGPDYDYDGYPDEYFLLAEFLMGDTGLGCTDTEVVITGQKTNGETRVGKAPINTDCDAGTHCH